MVKLTWMPSKFYFIQAMKAKNHPSFTSTCAATSIIW